MRSVYSLTNVAQPSYPSHPGYDKAEGNPMELHQYTRRRNSGPDPRYKFVANKLNKQTKAGLLKRAKSLAKRAREQGKNLAKQSRPARRVVDSVLTDPNIMALIPRGAAISKGYSQIKSSMRNMSISTSPCLKRWFDAMTVPFSQNAQSACIPFGGNLDSNRYFGYVRGDIIVGTNGVGFLHIAPSPYNDVNVLWATTAAFTGTTAEFVLSSAALQPGVTALRVPNNRFAASAVVNTAATQRDMPVSARLCGGGLRLYYVGTELNRGGLVSVYTNPTHQCVAYGTGGNTDSASLGALQETAIFPVSREVYEYPMTPLKTEELEYYTFHQSSVGVAGAQTAFAYPWSAGQAAQRGDGSTTVSGMAAAQPAGAVTTVVLISGAVPGSAIHFEYGMHCEAVGDLTEGQRLPSDSDPMGVDAMMAAISRYQIERNSHPELKSADVLRAQFKKVTVGRNQRVAL